MEETYINPIINDDFPDPSVIYVEGNGYFAYATHDDFSPTLNSILVRHSPDLIHWSAAEKALIASPIWAKNCTRFWCPQVVKLNDNYMLYYAAEPDTKDGMCLALATSKTPTNFKDIGYPLSRLPNSSYQMIDPCCFLDPFSNKIYLYYGSAHEPIRVVELSDDGITFLTAPQEVLWPLPDTKFEHLREGAYITFNHEFNRYFLWVSGDNTWKTNAYAISVYWSDNPTSGFKKIPEEHIILKGNAHWDSPGQNCIIKDKLGNDWIIYHAVDVNDRYITGTDRVKRKMCMDRILYTPEGWPKILNGSPSFEKNNAPNN